MIEQLIDRMINEGKVSREQLDSLINLEREKSPISTIEDMASVIAVQMEMIDSLGLTISMLMDKIAVLEVVNNA